MGMTLKPRNMVVLMVAASLASTIGGLPFNTLPVLLGSLADSFHLPPEQVGLLGSICFGGYLLGTLGTLGAPLWMNRLNWRWLTAVGAICTAVCFALSALVQALPLLYVSWACIGFFASTMTCLGMRVLSELPNKERAFGVRQGVELSVTAAVLFALPPLLIARFHYAGAAWALAALVLLLGVTAFWVPNGATVPLNSEAGSHHARRMPMTAWWALAVLWLFLVGNIGLWAFLERIGAHLSVSSADMGVVFAVLKLLGSVAAFFIATVGARWSLANGLAATLLGLLAGLGLLASASGFGFYAAGAWLWEFAFTCGCVLQTAHIARTDPSGRAIVLVPAAFALASMVGPGVAGKLMGAQGIAPVLWFALASSAVPVLSLLLPRKYHSNRAEVIAG